MTATAPSGGLLKPPSERPAGARGPRGPIAAVATLAALIPLAFGGVADETSWGEPVMLLSAGALVFGAGLLWTARRSVTLAAAVVLIVLGGIGAVVSIAAEQRAEDKRLNAQNLRGGSVFHASAATSYAERTEW